MARLFLTWAIALLFSACADSPQLVVEAPLLVFNSYPANGATLALGDLESLSVTFAEDVGDVVHVRERLAPLIDLADQRGGIRILREDGTNIRYVPEHFTLIIELEPELRAALEPGRYELTVRREVQTQAGRGLPADFVVRFDLVD